MSMVLTATGGFVDRLAAMYSTREEGMQTAANRMWGWDVTAVAGLWAHMLTVVSSMVYEQQEMFTVTDLQPNPSVRILSAHP